MSKVLRDPLKYLVAPTLFFLYSSILILYQHLVQPWMVKKKERITFFFMYVKITLNIIDKMGSI